MRECRAARVAEAEQLRGLVEGLAGGVVDGFAEQRVVADASTAMSWVWPPETSSATKGNPARLGQQRRKQMAFEVMNADDRLSQRRTQAGGDAGADQQRARQPGPWVYGDRVDVVQ